MNKLINILTVAVFLLALPFASHAGGDEVVVIYNTRVPASKPLAEYYAEQRRVPKEQVFGFELPTGEEISRADFRDALQKPLAKKLESAKLWRIGAGEMPGTNSKPVRVEG